MKKPRHATCNPKVIADLTEDYEALMLRKVMNDDTNENIDCTLRTNRA
jgi:hypothetical protein